MTDKTFKRLLLFLFAVSGASALIYEVAWTRALSVVLGSTVYALSTMLAAFMSGLALGSFIGGKIADKKDSLILYFGIAEAVIGIFGILSIPMIYALPPIYFRIYHSFHLNPKIFFIMQFLVSGMIMIIPTTLMGITFPLVSRAITSRLDEMGRMVGDAYAFNTIGAIAGSLSAGFLLIPVLGLKNTVFAAAFLNLLAGAFLISISLKKGKANAALILIFIYAISGALTLWAEPKYRFTTFYTMSRFSDLEELKQEERFKEVLFSKDYAEGRVAAYRSMHGLLTIQHGGKLEGTGYKDLPNTYMLAVLPAAALKKERPDTMLIIGLGAGVTALVSKQISRNVDVVEINPGIVEVVSRFGYPGLLENINIYIGDARQHLFYDEKTYDIITSEPSVPSESMAANLFTKEFYETASKRLNPGGIMCQWLPMWVLTTNDARSGIKTFAQVFEHVYVFKVLLSHDLLLIGSKEPIPYSPEEMIERAIGFNLSLPAEIEEAIRREKVEGEGYFQIELIRDSNGVKEIKEMADIPIITDDKPILEFAVTKNLLYGKEFRKIRK